MPLSLNKGLGWLKELSTQESAYTSTNMKRTRDSPVDQRVSALESRIFRLTLVLLTGMFVVVGGLLTIVAALVR